MHRHLHFLIPIFLFIFGVIYFSISFKAPNPDPVDRSRISGMVWTSGLLPGEQTALGIETDYQIVKSSDPGMQAGWSPKTNGVFLIDGGTDYSHFLGKCVAVSGQPPPGWENLESGDYEINGKWTYDRSAMIVRDISIIDLDNCLTNREVIRNQPDNPEIGFFTGSLGFAVRPAPDIGYDLEILLDEPYLDTQNAASGNSVLTSRLDISAGTGTIYRQALENIGRRVEINGYWSWGYAESRFFTVTGMVML